MLNIQNKLISHIYAKASEKRLPPLYFDDTSVRDTRKQRHLWMLLDFRWDFQEHWKSLLKKVNKKVALLRKFQNIVPRSALLFICKCFVRTHFDYGDIIYDQAFNNFFHQNVEYLQHITDVTRRTSRETIYQELVLKPLQQRRWYRKLCLFFKIYKTQCLKYLFDIIQQWYSPSTIIEWNKLDSNIRNSETLNIFKSKSLNS